MMSAMMDANLEAYPGRLDQSRQRSNPIPAIQHLQQSIAGNAHTNLPATNKPSQYLATQQSNQSSNQSSSQLEIAPAQATIITTKPGIRAEDIGYFDPDYQNEKEHGATKGPDVNAGKHVHYRDVYVFVDCLKDLAHQQDGLKIRNVVTECLHGSALMW